MKKAHLWPAALIAVLAVTVIGNIWVLYQATDHEAAVVEPDYYARAVRWDSTLAERDRDRELGWRIEADLARAGGGAAEVRVRVTDRAGAPLDGIAGRVTAIHNLDAARPLIAPLASRGRESVALLPRARAGLWELRLELTRGRDRCGAVLHRDLAGPVALR